MANGLSTGLIPYLRRVVASAGVADDADAPLLSRFAAYRDEAAFAALVHRHGPMVLGVCQRVLHHSHDAEDAFQATFLVLARKAGSVGRPDQLANWLYGVAYRTALEAKTQKARRHRKERQAMGAAAVETSHEAMWADVRQVLDDEVNRLPARFRLPFVLCYMEGKTNDEAARLLGCPSGTIYSRLAWARERLRSRLTGRGLGLSAALFTTLLAHNACSAAVPASLAAGTVKAALAFQSDTIATAVIASEVTALTQKVLLTMQWSTTKIITGLFLLGGLLLGARAFVLAQNAGDPQQPLVRPEVKPNLRAPQKGKAKPDNERIVGTWKLVDGQGNGEEVPPEFKTFFRMTFTKDDKMTISILDETAKEGTYKLPAAGQIDSDLGGGLGFGIYKFDGDDRLTICANNMPNGERPKEFSGAAGTGHMLLVFVRAKPGEEKFTPEELARNKEAVEKIREAAGRAQSANNLKQIGIAMHGYHDTYMQLPLHAIYSKDGKTPLLSWRVAILPFIEGQELYNQFKLDEPWDSAHNKKLIAKMPTIYEPLGMGKKGEGLTYYQVFTGLNTMFNGNVATRFADVTDGLSNTLLAIEGKDPVIWTKPADLTLPKDKDRLTPVGGLCSRPAPPPCMATAP